MYKGRLTMAVRKHELSNRYEDWTEESRTVAPSEKSDVVISLRKNGKHFPTLDLDVPHELIPSSTKGHSHLYIDVELSWWKYKRLLRALARAGIIEKGYLQASLERKHTAVRLPWVKKDTPWRGKGPGSL